MEVKKIKPKAIRKKRPDFDEDYDSDNGYDEHNHYYKDDGRKRRKSATDEPKEIHHHYYYEPPKKREPSSKPRIVGALLVIVGVLGLVMASIMFAGGAFVGNLGEGFGMFGIDDNADISGRITLPNGTPVEGVNVSIEGEPSSDITDADGYYMIYNVPTGNQKIRVEKAGFDTIIYKAFISPSNSDHDKGPGNNEDNKNEYDFTLHPGNAVVEQGSFPPFEFFESMMYVCAVVIVVLSIIVIIGAIYSFKRTHFAFVLIASIVGIFTIGLVIGSLLSIIALFILILACHEFNKHENNVNV